MSAPKAGFIREELGLWLILIGVSLQFIGMMILLIAMMVSAR